MRLTIRFKLRVAVVLGLVVVSVFAAGLLRFVYDRAARITAESSIRNAAMAFATLERNESEKLAATLHALAAHPELERRFREKDRAGLQRIAEPIFRELRDEFRITHWYFHLPDRRVFLRVHSPELHGDEVERATLARAVDTGDLATGKELGRTAFALRAVLPWRVGGATVGYLELGEEIDGFLHQLKAQTGDDLAMYVEKARLDPRAWAEQKERVGERNDWNDHRTLALVRATAPLRWPEVWEGPRVLPDTGEAIPVGADFGSVTGAFATRDGSGQRVAAVVVRHDLGAMRAGIGDVRGRVVLTVVLLAAGLAALIIFLLDTLVFDRLARMTELMEKLPERMARGDYHLEEELEPPPDDEIGRFETMFRRAVNVIRGALREIGRAQRSADGDP